MAGKSDCEDWVIWSSLSLRYFGAVLPVNLLLTNSAQPFSMTFWQFVYRTGSGALDYYGRSQFRLVEEDTIRRTVDYLAKGGLSANDITKTMVKVAVVDLDVLSDVLQDFEFRTLEEEPVEAITERRALSLGEQILGFIQERTSSFGNLNFANQNLEQKEA